MGWYRNLQLGWNLVLYLQSRSSTWPVTSTFVLVSPQMGWSSLSWADTWHGNSTDGLALHLNKCTGTSTDGLVLGLVPPQMDWYLHRCASNWSTACTWPSNATDGLVHLQLGWNLALYLQSWAGTWCGRPLQQIAKCSTTMPHLQSPYF